MVKLEYKYCRRKVCGRLVETEWSVPLVYTCMQIITMSSKQHQSLHIVVSDKTDYRLQHHNTLVCAYMHVYTNASSLSVWIAFHDNNSINEECRK